MSTRSTSRHASYFPSERKALLRRRLIGLGLALLAFALLHLLDRWLFLALKVENLGEVESKAWYQILRQTGDVRTWLLVALVLASHMLWSNLRALPVPRIHPGAIAGIVASPIIAGLIAELLKLILGRERPADSQTGEYQHYVFKGLMRGFVDSSNLGLPSSHAAVAFGAAFILGRAFPGAGLILIPVAAGCALTRMLAGRHFATDVVLGAIVGWLSALLVARALRRLMPGAFAKRAG